MTAASAFSTNSRRRTTSLRLACAASALLALAFAGCTSTDISNRPRTALEQLLLSNATDNALASAQIPEVRGMTVYVDDQYLESYDKPYVLGSIRDLLSRNGALLQAFRADAEVIVEPRSGVLGNDHAESLLGLPSIPIPIPGVGTMETPELSLYSSRKDDSVAKIALLGYRKDGSPLFSNRSYVGKSHFHQYKLLLLLNVNRTDISARKDY